MRFVPPMTGKSVAVWFLCLAIFAGVGSAQVIFSNIPTPVPPNVASQAFEATSTSEFGTGVTFSTGTGRLLGTVRVIMSSWGCVTGAWFSNDCVTPPGSTFNHPITLNIYNQGTAGAVGSLITTKTVTFAIPYRPSADNVHCTGPDLGKWYDPGTGLCKNGLATPIVFDFSSAGVTLPDKVIITVAYNTSDYGYNPIGRSTACAIVNNCPYDSLNVGAETHLSVGSFYDPNGAYLNSSSPGFYCSGAAGTLRLDTGVNCWTAYQPSFEVSTIAQGAFMVGYVANLSAGDSVVNISNTGQSAGVNGSGNLCANLYVISPDEQVIACCSCPVTPNGLVSLSAKNDLAFRTLTPAVPGAFSVLILGSANTGTCSGSNPGSLAPGLVAWGSTLHSLPSSGLAVAEISYPYASLSSNTITRLTSMCGFIQANGSGYGLCGICRSGALGGVRQ